MEKEKKFYLTCSLNTWIYNIHNTTPGGDMYHWKGGILIPHSYYKKAYYESKPKNNSVFTYIESCYGNSIRGKCIEISSGEYYNILNMLYKDLINNNDSKPGYIKEFGYIVYNTEHKINKLYYNLPTSPEDMEFKIYNDGTGEDVVIKRNKCYRIGNSQNCIYPIAAKEYNDISFNYY